MQSPAPSSSPDPRDDRFARKARILLDLFGPSGVERLKQAGLPADLLHVPGAPPAEHEAEGLPDDGRRALLKRLRDHGLLEAETAPRAADPVGTASLSALIAEHLDGNALAGEHPAVIAHVLRTRPRAVQLRVLRALPGSVARAVMRFLKV